MMAAPNRPRVFLDVSLGEHPAGRLTIELFADKTPKTCENFRQLCTGEHDGLSYAKAPFHRVIDEFMVQGGDIANGDGTGTKSIYGGEFEDEALDWREMDAAGLLCAANRGKDTNGSQFFLTLEPCRHLNGKHTIFGRLVSGQDVLEKIAKVDVDEDDRPLEPVLIARCGELEKKKKAKKSVPEPVSAVETHASDRGRRRKSNGSDQEMVDTPEPPPIRKSRRQSDNVVDEGIRGRPRNRSGARSQPLSTPSEDDENEEHSPAQQHKRKRSASPSRHVDDKAKGEDDEEYHRRRRRSLPNQYQDARDKVHREDEDRYRPNPRRDDHQAAPRRRNEGYDNRRDDGRGDRYRPAGDEDRHGRLGGDDGRLGGGGGYDDHDPPVKFKGRGVMKYREPGRL